jgi:hypothetical protein
MAPIIRLTIPAATSGQASASPVTSNSWGKLKVLRPNPDTQALRAFGTAKRIGFDY